MHSKSIPKKIHYCWFGGKKLPDQAIKCIDSWKKYMPDYEIIEWNEKNFDYTSNEYANEAYNNHSFAFVSDYARLKILYEEGGIYFDVDVELIKPITKELLGDGFLAMEDSNYIATGLGFSCRPKDKVIGMMLKDYDEIHFMNDNGHIDLTPCPVRNTKSIKHLVKKGDKFTNVCQLRIYGNDYFNPLDYKTGILNITENTLAIHHGMASWLDDIDKSLLLYRHRMTKKYGYRIGRILYLERKLFLYLVKKPKEFKKFFRKKEEGAKR